MLQFKTKLMIYTKLKKIFDTLFLGLMFTLVVGTPLVYTSITRSVFEVNKLLLLRIILLIGVFLWVLKYLVFRDNGYDNSAKESYEIFGLRWKRIGLEIPLLLWLITNFVSTIFSQNIRVSIIGSYDRWEGILTVFNYITLIIMFAKLTTKEFQVRWISFGLICSTAIAAIYGVLQSVGFDFMHWSKDPTFRVFASINNPVHYCAYVAMAVPFGISLLLYKGKRFESYKLGETEPMFYKAIQFFLFFIMALVVLLNSYFSTGFVTVDTTFFILVFSWVISLFISSPKLKLPFLFIVFLLLLNGFVFNSQLSIPFFQVSLLLGGIWYICHIFNTDTYKEATKLIYISAFTLLLLTLSHFEWLNLTRPQWVGFFFVASMISILFTAPKWQNAVKSLLFICTCIIYYTQGLSFSRATWVGFLLMMPLYYLLVTKSLNTISQKKFIKDFFITIFMLGIFCLNFIFRVYAHHKLIAIVSISLFLLSLILLIRNNKTKTETLSGKELIYFGLFLICIYPVFMLITKVSFAITFKCLLVLAMYWLSHQLSGVLLRTQERVVLMLFFAHLQLSGGSLFNFLLYFIFITLYYFQFLRHKDISRADKHWLFYFLVAFGVLISVPTVPTLMTELEELFFNIPAAQFGAGSVTLSLILIIIYLINSNKLSELSLVKNQSKLIIGLGLVAAISTGASYTIHLTQPSTVSDNQELKVARNIKARSDGYKDSIKEARIAMWKSAIPWIKDYPIIGSGLDTIKYMYPVYRIPEYGKREGGHNFTPDRMHNEYINTLCSKGILGFIVYYLIFLLGWYLTVLKGIYQVTNPKVQLITIACLVSAGIFLGQLLFNFGVVATMILFYICIGMGYALSSKNYED